MANIILQGQTTDQLSELICESVRDEISCLRPHKPDQETEYLSRKEVLALLRIDSFTLWSWEKSGYIYYKVAEVQTFLRRNCKFTPETDL